ncbi:protein GL2-INTERACTING REPRESSOR 1-like [Juglans microcarpa x Juglans regia]|uniref:protein GL2-INTERACTING REPRESSOR 1-like n=1 Tax=Juglans microcarpa x Juglans regia TaxID=2249226 RepID=UPI001B7DADE4|nr:protein GL2-INTERACTING REPRESSOR 1-like [Juglans microcarpa x Juglans regia]
MYPSTQNDLGDPNNIPVGFQNICDNESGSGCIGKETKKRCFMEMRRYDISRDVDLELRLSPPGVSFWGKSSKTSPLSSQETTTSLDLNSSDYLDDSSSILEVPSLCLMGCTLCLIYVMVSEADPKCPKCKRSFLIDMFRDNLSKGCRKSYL